MAVASWRSPGRSAGLAPASRSRARDDASYRRGNRAAAEQGTDRIGGHGARVDAVKYLRPVRQVIPQVCLGDVPG